MSDPKKPDPRLQSAEHQKQQAAASHETNRPADSTPVVAGQFTNLPATFGRYQVKKLLGRGAMGAVYLAVDTQLDRPVALKIPKVAASGSKRLLQRLETEAKAAAKLDHPSLCKVFDAGSVGEQCFIAMQYIEGETLKSQLEATDKPVAEVVSLILQLAEGLSEAHALGIIHRDLKPENIMINRRGTPVIMDFGLAKFSTIGGNAAATQAGTILGSPAYMSPEQASGNSQVIDQRSDIYALGTILFEMLTGQWPFSGSAMQILGQKSLLDPPAVRSIQPALPPQLAATCDKMLAKDPLDRYQHLAEVIADLKRIDFNRSPQASVVRSLPSSIEIGEYEAAEPADVRIAPVSKWLRSRPAPVSRRTASIPWLKQLQDWWNGQTPAIKWTMSGSAGALLVMLGIILLFPTRHGTLQIEIADPSLAVRFDGTTAMVQNGKQTYSVTPTDRHTLEFLQDGVAIESATRELTLKRGEKRLVTFKLLDGKVVIDGQAVSQELKTAATNVAQSDPVRHKTGKSKSAPTTGLGSHQWPADAPAPAIAPFDKDQAKAYQEAWARYLKVDAEYTNSIGMKFRLIPPGDFLMGSTPQEIEAVLKAVDSNPYWQKFIQSESPQHRVILTQPIYLGIHEVTQEQYKTVTGKTPSWFVAMAGGKDKIGGLDTASFPVEIVSWNDATEFCTKLSQLEALRPCYGAAGERLKPQDGDGYRLPTEAEWEFACRAGTTRKYWIGDQDELLGLTGWFPANSQQRTHAVGALESNPFGLYDTHGNVWEWVEDWWEPTYYRQFRAETAVDPSGPSYALADHIAKGGSWYETATACRASSRDARDSTARSHDIGFRVMLAVDAVRKLPKAAVSVSPQNESNAPVNKLSEAEQAAGWKLLFDGKSMAGWRNFKQTTIGPGWRIVDGTFVVEGPRAGDIVTTDQYDSFELALEYNISKGGNSGLMYHVTEVLDKPWMSAPEIQILDNKDSTDGQKSGWLYLLYSSETDATKPAGEWNQLRILITPEKCQHFMNGTKYCEYIIGSDDWNSRVANSKFGKDSEFGKAKKGHICLQDHGNLVAFRNVKIRSIGKPDSRDTEAQHAPIAPPGQSQIPADAVMFRTKRYKVFTESLTWHEARKKCQDLGGRLADVRNASENTFLAKLAGNQNVEGVWLGATDEVTEGRWLWGDGKEMKYQNWSSVGQQPNNKANGEHYLLMTLKVLAGEWSDQPATSTEYKTGYICEWDKPQMPVAAENGWKSVFNGKNLSGWTPMLSSEDGQGIATHRPTSSGWIVRGEELICNTGQPGWLKLNKSYGDCEFDFEFYLPRDSNSGVLVRCPERGVAFRVHQCEIQLEYDTSPQVKPIQKCGGLSGVLAPSELAFKAGVWNHMNVSLRQDRILVRLNEKLVVDTALADHNEFRGLAKEGNFGLFNWKGLAKGCKFRNLRIKEIKPIGG